jgi:putative sigma-54 modulation protein
MKVTYTGRQVELSPAHTTKLTAEFGKIGKLLDNGRGESEARVVLKHERHLNEVEITISHPVHDLVGHGSDTDLFTAIHSAIGKLESQAVKVREKQRDGKRAPRDSEAGGEAEV